MRTRVAAIEFGTSKIVTLIAESGSYHRLGIIGSGTVPYDGYRDGDWIAPGKLAQAVYNSISAAEKDANTKIKDI
ncbi:MAG: cell division protein FtsA, partial [Clostridia bacterium]|nr:cell division protein FtsA [Clostridia bacterium]